MKLNEYSLKLKELVLREMNYQTQFSNILYANFDDWMIDTLTEDTIKTASKAMPSQKYQASQKCRGGRLCTNKQHCELQQQYKQYLSDVQA